MKTMKMGWMLMGMFMVGCTSEVGQPTGAGGGTATVTTATAGGGEVAGSGGGAASTATATGGGCLLPSDCFPGHLCMDATCIDGVCGMEPTPTGVRCGPIGGVPLSCDGKGACVAVVPEECQAPKPTEPESCATGCDDGNPCTDDYCQEDNQACFHTAFASGVECGGVNVCRSGYCCLPTP